MADYVGQQLGNYHLLRLLGQGAFATVYLGKHQYLEREAAIKVLHTRIAADRHESFRREARTIAQLQHPHIISVYDFGVQDDLPYLVMEYTVGGTVLSHHKRGTQLSFEQIICYVKQIASALDYAHAQHVIHRDVKPENILLKSRHEAILSDFGIAVVLPTLDSLSTQGAAGTPLYMAPEQIRGKPCAASDQYALGVMVYEWLTGEAPFRGVPYQVLHQHLNVSPPSLCARLPQFPQAVEDAVFATLAKDPHHRFSTVEDFATALSQALETTEQLTLRGSVAREKTKPLLTQRGLVPTSSGSQQQDCNETIQPHLKTTQRTPYEQEQAPNLQSVTPHQPLPKQRLAKALRIRHFIGQLSLFPHPSPSAPVPRFSLMTRLAVMVSMLAIVSLLIFSLLGNRVFKVPTPAPSLTVGIKVPTPTPSLKVDIWWDLGPLPIYAPVGNCEQRPSQSCSVIDTVSPLTSPLALCQTQGDLVSVTDTKNPNLPYRNNWWTKIKGNSGKWGWINNAYLKGPAGKVRNIPECSLNVSSTRGEARSLS